MTKNIGDILSVGNDFGVFTRLDYGMDEVDWSAAEGKATSYKVGWWEGKVGQVDFPETTYDEACWIAEGRVAIIDANGGRKEFSAGQGYILPKGFAGQWITLEDAKKFYVILA